MTTPQTEGMVFEDGFPGRETSDNSRIYRVAVIAPTCFYYQVPLFQQLHSNPRIDLTVYFCSDEANRGEDVVKKFGTGGSWGSEEELLEGYRYKFLKNYSPWPSYLNSLVGLMNFGIWREISRNKPDVVILMSWMNPTWWLAILACLYLKIPFLYLTDQNVQRDIAAPRWKRSIKRLILGGILFRLTSGFLCAGTANRMLYRHYGVPENKLVPFAFSWGFDKLLEASDRLKCQRNRLRSELGIPQQNYVVLYCGRLSPEKNPLLLLQAYEKVDNPNKSLAIVGNGRLGQTLEEYAADHGLDSVYFFGFRNRLEIPDFYAIADVLVLPSDQETWGIVVNEAMCFGLPVIVSDQVGAGRDLVRQGYNGFTFPKGNQGALTRDIQQLMDLNEHQRSVLGSRSLELIEQWVHRDLAQSLDRYFDFLFAYKDTKDG